MKILLTIWLVLIFLETVLLIGAGLLNKREIWKILYPIARSLVIIGTIPTILGIFGYAIYLLWQ